MQDSKNKERFAGIMSGTSLDAVDVAVCDFYFVNGRLKCDLIAYQEVPLAKAYRDSLKRIMNESINIKEISQMNFSLAKLYSDSLIELCEKADIDVNSITAVGVHGQTVWHNPEKENFCGYDIASTLQLVSIPAMKERLGIKVIGDFRSADIALGGQGAPLVPIFDWEFIRSENENIVSVNIGGMSNITYLPRNCTIDDILGFDCGPGNVLLDLIASKYFNKRADYNGEIANTGKLLPSLLKKLMSIPFIHQAPPKSTGRELFNANLLNELQVNLYNPEDILRTLTEFTAASIAKHITELPAQIDKTYCSGGGAKNIFLMERIRQLLPKSIEINKIESIGINSDAKEAICFAYLAYLNYHNLKGNVPAVTGASRRTILGIS